MTFGVAWALLGLLAIPILLLLERWRRRPRRVQWPSLLLWRGVAASSRAARRRIEPLLLYECAAVCLLSLAAAEPAFGTGSAGLSAIVLVDEGPHMQARRRDGRSAYEATQEEIRKIRDAVPDTRVLPVSGDVAQAAAAMPEADLRVLATGLADVEGEGYVVVGFAGEGINVGIDAVEVDGDRIWFALAADGDAGGTAAVSVGGQRLQAPIGRGMWADFGSPIALLEKDNYDGDDRIELRRLALVARNETRSDLVRIALYEAGTKAAPGDDPDLILTNTGGTPHAGIVRGADCVVEGELFDGLLLDECVWRDPRTLEGPGLLTWRGRALARWVDERTLWLGLPLDRDWDDHDTLAVLIERAKRARVELRAGEAIVGDAIATPPPGAVRTRGVDRPWDGKLPGLRHEVAGATGVRPVLALLALGVLVLYLLRLRA